MTNDRKNIKVAEATFNELDADKPDGVTWDYYLTELRKESPQGASMSESDKRECPLCRGSGELGGGVCEACGGYGTVYSC